MEPVCRFTFSGGASLEAVGATVEDIQQIPLRRPAEDIRLGEALRASEPAICWNFVLSTRPGSVSVYPSARARHGANWLKAKKLRGVDVRNNFRSRPTETMILHATTFRSYRRRTNPQRGAVP